MKFFHGLFKDRITKKNVIELSPITIRNCQPLHGCVSITVVRGDSVETVLMGPNDTFQLYRSINISLKESKANDLE